MSTGQLELQKKLLAAASILENSSNKWIVPILDEAFTALRDDTLTVSFTFKTEEEANLFKEYAMTAFALWRFNTGRLTVNKPHCNLSNKDEEEDASLKKTEHPSL